MKKIDPVDLEYRHSFSLLSSIVMPRPILLVATVNQEGGFNVAPYALLTGLCVKPFLVGFTVVRKRNGEKKDTQKNIESSGDFVLNVVTESLANRQNLASQDYPYGVDEFKEAGMTPVQADIVRSPLVAESPVNMECRLERILDFGESRISSFIIGEVIRVHIEDEVYSDNDIDPAKLKALGRLSGAFYCRTTDIFEMEGPHREY